MCDGSAAQGCGQESQRRLALGGELRLDGTPCFFSQPVQERTGPEDYGSAPAVDMPGRVT
jgi:hypothetical protein